jgi:signal transduction histidine kinase
LTSVVQLLRPFLACLLLGIAHACLATTSAPWHYDITDSKFEQIKLGTVARLSLDDKTGSLNADQMAQVFDQSGGLVMKYHDSEITRVIHPAWARLTIRNKTPTAIDFVLYHAQPTVEQQHAYVLRQGSWISLIGEHQTATQAFQRYRGPSYNLSLSPNETADILVRTHTYSPILFPLEVRSHVVHQQLSHEELAIYTVATMLPLLVVVAMLLLRRISSIQIDTLFLAFVFCDMLGASWITGTQAIVFPLANPLILRYLGVGAYCVLGVLAIWHSILFLRLDTLCPRWSYALKMWAVFGAIIMLYALAFEPLLSSRVMLSFNFTTAAIVSCTCAYAWRKEAPWSGIYFAAWFIYVLSSIVYILYRLDYLPLIAFGFAVFWQNAGVCLLLGGAVLMSVFARDTRLQDALDLADKRQEQLELSNRERDRLFAAASHDLRQPLQAMAINLSLMKPTSREERAISERFRLAVVSMGDILSSLLDLRRAAGDGLEAHLQDVELQPLLERLCEDYREQARLKQLSFRSVQTRTTVVADPVWLERILRNLITNSLRYTDHGRVLLGVRREGDLLKICVIDTGRGLNAQQIENLQSDALAAPNPELRDSYGLGLYIVKRLCQKMQAQLRVFSVLNQGSRIEVVLPAAKNRALKPSITR